jgi:hypothetical protein
MSQGNSTVLRSRWLRFVAAALLVVALIGGVYTVWPSRQGDKVPAPS